MNATQSVRPLSDTTPKEVGGELRVSAESRAVRRRLGPLPWAVLEELALSARPHEDSWVAAVGVRALGVAVGVTKDTAARAVTTLKSAGIVTQVRVRTPDGRSISAYRLQLPEGISVHGCPAGQDTQATTVHRAAVPRKDRRALGQRERSRVKRQDSAVQVSLFDYPIPQAG